jgi:hypothetical protein
MQLSIWTIIADIASILGGLSALVFFYDRFRHHLGGQSRPKPSTVSISTKWLGTVTTALCFVGSASVGVVGFKFGSVAQYLYSTIGGAPFLLFSEWLDKKGFKEASQVVMLSCGCTGMGGLLAAMAGSLFYYLSTGDGNLHSYAGSSGSLFAAIFCLTEAVIFSCLIFRWKWFDLE